MQLSSVGENPLTLGFFLARIRGPNFRPGRGNFESRAGRAGPGRAAKFCKQLKISYQNYMKNCIFGRKSVFSSEKQFFLVCNTRKSINMQ